MKTVCYSGTDDLFWNFVSFHLFLVYKLDDLNLSWVIMGRNLSFYHL